MKPAGYIVPVIHADGRVIQTFFKSEADAIRACEQYEEDFKVHVAKETANFLDRFPPPPPPAPSLWKRFINFMDRFSQVGPGGVF